MKKKIIYIAMIGLLSSLSSCMLFTPSSSKMFARAQKMAPYDAIIVPGVPYDSSIGKWSDVMKIRVYWSHYLYTHGIAKNIIYSGSAVYTPFVEGKIMAMYAEQLGIPKENIFIDSNAEHSTENLYYSYYLAQKQGFTKIAVATDPFQAYMLRKFPKKVSITMDFIPIVFKTLGALELKDLEIDCQSARMCDFVALPERESFWKRMQGTMGKNIRPVPEDIRFIPSVQNVQLENTSDQ